MIGRNKPPSRDRTPEERAAAAAERARRRGATGEADALAPRAPAQPPGGAEPPQRAAEPPPREAGPPARAAEPTPREAEPPAPAAEPTAPDPAPVPMPPVDPVRRAPDPVPVPDVPPAPAVPAPEPELPAPVVPEPEPAPPAAVVREPEPAPPAPVVREPEPAPPAPAPPAAAAPPRAPEPPAERPLPPRPRAAGERRPLPPRPGDARRPPDAPRAPRERRGIGARVLALLGLLVVGAALWLIYQTFQPGKADGTGAVAVTIPPGTDAGRIGEILQAEGVVENATFFNLNATLTGRRGKLKSGDYTLPKDMSNGDALDALVQGPKAKVVKTFKFTIPEGRTRREAAPLVKKAGFEGDYLKATTEPSALRRARRLGLPRASRNPEGFLFPSTYEMLAGATARDLVTRQLQTFGEQMGEVDMAAARRRNLSRYDVLVIASMVEREAQLDKERPLIAAVIHNRLREGMPLGIDATIRYVENNWTEPLKQSELTRDTPYNTRLRRGLPPTPIGNPGLASLKAAAKPAKVDYLFYVVKPGTCGEHAFSSTDAEFSRDVARYNSAREEAGGKSPTTC